MPENKIDYEKEYKQLLEKYDQLDSIVRYFLERQGCMIRVARRDYRDFVGVLVKAHFKLEKLELYEQTDKQDYSTGKNLVEEKFVTYDVGNLIQYEFIVKSEMVEREK